MTDRDNVTVVETGGGGGGAGLVGGIIAAVLVLGVVVYLFGGSPFGAGGGKTVNVDVNLPNVEAPAAPAK